MTSGPPPCAQDSSATKDLASVARRARDGVPVVAISGEIDISNVDEIASAFIELPATTNGLVVDLSETRYLDSSAIALLHDLASRLEKRSQRLVLVSPRGSVPRLVLDLTAMDAHALCVEELGPAIHALSD